MGRIVGLTLVLSLLAMVVASCGDDEPEGSVKIGLALELSGPGASSGPLVEEGIRAAFSEVGNEVEGRELTVIVEDTASDPAVSLDKVRKLVESDNVDLIVGPIFSNAVQGTAPYLAEQKIPNISIYQHPADITKHPYIYAAGGTLKDPTYVLGQYIYDELGYRSITTLGIDYVAGWDFVGGVVQGFQDRGGQLVQQQWHPFGTFDFAPFLTTLEEADAIVLWPLADAAPVLLRQLKEFGVDMPVVAAWAGGAVDEALLGDMGDTAAGVHSVSYYAPLTDTQANREWLDSFKAQTGIDPTGDAHFLGYRTGQIVIEALKRSGGSTDPDKLADAIQGVELDTPVGRFSFDDSRFGRQSFYIIRVDKVGDEYRHVPVKEIPDVYFGF